MDQESFRTSIDAALDRAMAGRPKYLGWIVAGAVMSMGLILNFRGRLAEDPGLIVLIRTPSGWYPTE